MKKYSVELTELAEEDLKNAKEFYDLQADFLGNYFIDSILVDLDSLVGAFIIPCQATKSNTF